MRGKVAREWIGLGASFGRREESERARAWFLVFLFMMLVRRPWASFLVSSLQTRPFIWCGTASAMADISHFVSWIYTSCHILYIRWKNVSPPISACWSIVQFFILLVYTLLGVCTHTSRPNRKLHPNSLEMIRGGVRLCLILPGRLKLFFFSLVLLITADPSCPTRRTPQLWNSRTGKPCFRPARGKASNDSLQSDHRRILLSWKRGGI